MPLDINPTTDLEAAERNSTPPWLSKMQPPNNAAATAKQTIQAATESRQPRARTPGWYHMALPLHFFEETSCTTGFCDNTYAAMASRSAGVRYLSPSSIASRIAPLTSLPSGAERVFR